MQLLQGIWNVDNFDIEFSIVDPVNTQLENEKSLAITNQSIAGIVFILRIFDWILIYQDAVFILFHNYTKLVAFWIKITELRTWFISCYKSPWTALQDGHGFIKAFYEPWFVNYFGVLCIIGIIILEY